MALPKKGTRKIVVDDTTYKYRVRGGGDDRSCVLTVEGPDKKIVQKVINMFPMTPANVAESIRNWDK